MIDNKLPPIGSTWEHCETQERRLVQAANAMPSHECVGFSEPGNLNMRKRLSTTWCSLSDWLAWQANAERIDKETSDDPR